MRALVSRVLEKENKGVRRQQQHMNRDDDVVAASAEAAAVAASAWRERARVRADTT